MQLKDPGVLTQDAFLLQSWMPVVHSLISEECKITKIEIKPLGKGLNGTGFTTGIAYCFSPKGLPQSANLPLHNPQGK